MNSILQLQRVGWLLQGIVGVFAAFVTAAYGLWGVFSAGAFPTAILLLGAVALALIAGYYFATRVLKLRERLGSTAAVKLFLQAEYNWAIGSWCLVIAAFAAIFNTIP